MVVLVTRAGQITLDKKIRRKLGIEVGTPLEANMVGDLIVISKRDKSIWRRSTGILPSSFDATLDNMRSDYRKRMKRLGLQ